MSSDGGSFGLINNQNFSGGWVTVAPAHVIEGGSTPSVQNVDFSESFGRLTKRKGHSLYMAANQGGSVKVCGMHQYIQEDADEFLLVAANDDVYDCVTDTTWTSIHTNASLNGADVQFTTFN